MLTEEEKQLEEDWKKYGVLRPLDPEIIPLFEQAVIFSCYDKRYFSQWYRQMSEMASRQQGREIPDLFPIICGGSPLIVAPSSPIHCMHDHRPMVESSVGLAQEHGCSHAAILGHYPCLAGEKSKISLLHNVALLVEGKKWLTARGMKAVLLFDLKDEEEAPSIWHLKASEFEIWCRTRKPDFVTDNFSEIIRNI